MSLFQELKDASIAEGGLNNFIENNIQEIYDFLEVQNFTQLNLYKDDLDEYIVSNLNNIKSLDLEIESSRVFVLLLLDVSDRLGLLFPFQQLYKLLKREGCDVGSHIEGSALFFNKQIKSLTDYRKVIPQLLNFLKEAFNNEGEIEDRLVGTIVNYYAQAVHNYAAQNKPGVLSIKDELLQFEENKKHFFLSNPLILKILSLEIQGNIATYNEIQFLLSSYLEEKRLLKIFPTEEILIEEGTSYEEEIEEVNVEIYAIRNISVAKYKEINDSKLYYSLQNGVEILKEENQLYAYMYSYGLMHFAKLSSAIEFLPSSLFGSSINVIDWGCGQGLAAMTLLDFLTKKNIKTNFSGMTLIEPSSIAIQRAALHIKKFKPNMKLMTINKKISELIEEDLINIKTNTKIHFFSNILDINQFSLTDLVKLINSKFKGVNYFICVSPLINDLRTNRLNTFMDSFLDKNNFSIINSVDNTKGEWEYTWTRVLRIFRADL